MPGAAGADVESWVGSFEVVGSAEKVGIGCRVGSRCVDVDARRGGAGGGVGGGEGMRRDAYPSSTGSEGEWAVTGRVSRASRPT